MFSLPVTPKDVSRRSVHRSLSSSLQGSAVSMQHLGMAPSVYGGAGGRGTRISTTSRNTVSYGSDLIGSGDLFVGNEKMAMQNLNDRLASYLEKVRALEESNSKLEVQIKQWYEANAPSGGRDDSAYYRQIEELRNQIKDAQLINSRCILQIDNAKLAAEDFRLKFETERGIRLTVEADLQGLSKVFDDLTLQKTDLEVQIEDLNRDLALLKKEHQEEVDSLHRHLGNTVNVEVDAAPGRNLGAIMNEMRQKYEDMAQKNLQEAKEQFERKESLEHTLEETKARYSIQLANLQSLLSSLEAQLMQIRSDTERQNNEYHILLDIKTRLEQEIATYRRLLEGEDVKITEYQLSTQEEKDIKKTRKIKTVVEEVVDGKVVSSEVREVEENI
ncbi:keratin, type I cytoskeletal 20 [Cebus imitator]|uniref:Keratin, type I cytoskeletal 20 n=1 Tax=Cebus imitator TaxID=2715852 RepID=A0A2K5RNZ7_CEBIM|nr:keratin, type I cytoskeletal 20 [Cebus imitator]